MIALNERDERAFSRALVEKFPGLRFLREDYSAIDIGEWGRRERGPDELDIEYYDSLAERHMKRGWIEPDGWKPLWRGPNREGVYTIANPPRLEFHYQPGGLPYSGPKTDFHDGQIYGGYRRGDKEHLSFINAVIRLSEKFTCDVMDVYNRWEDVWYRDLRSSLYIGLDVLRWASEDDSRWIAGRYRPATSWTMPELPRWYDE